MGSRIIVYKKVVPGANLEETMQKCLMPYGDNLLADSGLEDIDYKDQIKNAIEVEGLIAKHSNTFLPARFKGKGYDRLNSVFAFPFEFPDGWCYPNLVPPNRSFAEGETVMRMMVDGSSALVLPMSAVNNFYRQDYSCSEQKDMRKIKEYWGSAVTLKEFTQEFENPREREYIWYSKDGTKRIETPEVMIPKWSLGTVSFVNK